MSLELTIKIYGIPLEIAKKKFTINPHQRVTELEQLLKKNYMLNPLMPLIFIYKGRVLPSNISLTDLDLGSTDEIGAFCLMTGG